MQNAEIIIHLLELSARELAEGKEVLSKMDDAKIAMITIEACRVLDYWYVIDAFSSQNENKMPEQDLNIMSRGWNPLLQQVLPRLGTFPGIPLLGSTKETIQAASAELHRFGRHILLKRAAELVDRGLAEGSQIDGVISVQMKHRKDSDHFLDQIDVARWEDFSKKLQPSDLLAHGIVEVSRLANFQEELERLMFRWETPQGVMAGYRASPQLDDHFIGAVFDHVSECLKKSGIHPEASIRGISARDVHVVVMLLMSARLKHTQFVATAKRQWPDVNYWMSLTIWKPKSEIVAELSEAIKIDPFIVSAIIDLFTIGQDKELDLSSDVDPLIPFFIKISDRYLLEPASILFLNPFDIITRINPDQRIHQTISERREGLMLVNLNGLFQGSRYIRLEAPVRLRAAGRIVTDIDGAILDLTTGELALFQLKWQDFKGATLKQTLSRAKNFVGAVSTWAKVTSDWIDEYGIDQLLRALRMPSVASAPVLSVYLFAIGQMSARFGQYGYAPENNTPAITTWSQFLRIRHEVGPAERVITQIFARVKAEEVGNAAVSAHPYEMHSCGQVIRFENMWNKLELLD
jgi:hypothetical protein